MLMFSGLFITLSLCRSWGHILELFSFTFQKILEGKDKCRSASVELMVSEKSKHSPGSLCFYLPLGNRLCKGKAQAAPGLGSALGHPRLSLAARGTHFERLRRIRVPAKSQGGANSSHTFPEPSRWRVMPREFLG